MLSPALSFTLQGARCLLDGSLSHDRRRTLAQSHRSLYRSVMSQSHIEEELRFRVSITYEVSELFLATISSWNTGSEQKARTESDGASHRTSSKPARDSNDALALTAFSSFAFNHTLQSAVGRQPSTMDHGNFAAEADYSSTGENDLDALFLDSFSSAHSSGASDGGPGAGAGDYSFESDLMGSYLASNGQEAAGSTGVALAGHGGGGGHQGYYSGSSASSVAALSNISSPSYSNYGALSGNNSNFESLATGTSPPFSFGTTVDTGHSGELQQPHAAMFDPRSQSLQNSDESNYYGSATSIQQPLVHQQYLPQASLQLHHQVSPPQLEQQLQQNHFTHYTPQHSANSLSPPSSASSSTGAYQNTYPAMVQPTSGTGGESLLARMMAEAEAQGRSQSDVQAAYASSYVAGLAQAQAVPRHPFSTTPDAQNNPLPYHTPSSFSTTYTQQPYEDRKLGADQLKKRRVSTTDDFSTRESRIQHKTRGATSGGRRAVSSTAAPPPQSYVQQQQLAAAPSQDGFHFALNSSVANGAGSIAEALSAVPRHAAMAQAANSSLNLIANAGVLASTHRGEQTPFPLYLPSHRLKADSRLLADGPSPRAYQAIAPAAVMQDVPPPVAPSTSAVKAGKRVAEKAGAKKPAGGEKRKKGEKGHSESAASF